MCILSHKLQQSSHSSNQWPLALWVRAICKCEEWAQCLCLTYRCSYWALYLILRFKINISFNAPIQFMFSLLPTHKIEYLVLWTIKILLRADRIFLLNKHTERDWLRNANSEQSWMKKNIFDLIKLCKFERANSITSHKMRSFA